jgi:hypothetical protein
MPARHMSLPTIRFPEADMKEQLLSTKEGVGETSGQVAGSQFWQSMLWQEPVRQKKLVFFVR